MRHMLDARIAVGAYSIAGIQVISKLLSKGVQPNHLAVLTHAENQNAPLLEFLRLAEIETSVHLPSDTITAKWLKSFSPDILLSVHYRKIFPTAILEIPKCAAINLHPSLLPKHRGAFSSVHALIDGDLETGISWHYMTSNVDQGNVLIQKRTAIRDSDTAQSLFYQLIHLGTNCVAKAVKLALSGNPGVPQQGSGSYHSRQLPNRGIIDPSWPEQKIDRFIRAMWFPPHKRAVCLDSQGLSHEVSNISEYKALVRPNCSK